MEALRVGATNSEVSFSELEVKQLTSSGIWPEETDWKEKKKKDNVQIWQGILICLKSISLHLFEKNKKINK